MRFEKTQRTPLVEMSNSHCLIMGECYPENISEWSQPVLAALHHAPSSSSSPIRIVRAAGHVGLEYVRDAARRLASFAFVAAAFHVAAPFAAMSTARALHGSVFGLVRLVADDATSAKCR